MAWSIREVLTRIINLVLAVVTFFLGARIILRLFDANPITPFVGWIYQISDSLIYPFTGIFPNYALTTGTTIDVVALVSLIAYALLAYVVLSLINSVFHAPEDTYVHTENRHI